MDGPFLGRCPLSSSPTLQAVSVGRYLERLSLRVCRPQPGPRVPPDARVCAVIHFMDMAAPTYSDVESMDIRVGTIVRCQPNERSRNPAFALWIDLGDGRTKQSSAQITDLYDPDDLVGTQVAVITGIEPMRVAGFLSEVLVIGAITDAGVVLLRPDRPVGPGSRVA